MGYGAAFDLVNNSPDVESVTVADISPELASECVKRLGSGKAKAVEIDVADDRSVADLMKGNDAAISCVNYWYNERLSELAIETNTHFCDLGGNNTVVARQLELDSSARKGGVSIIPDCGLAPGMVSLLAMHGKKRFEDLSGIRIRVGGLPRNPQPPLDYQLVFSVEGLINEYVELARVVREGKTIEVESMTELEELHFEGFPRLEAFQTSGGTSTLPESLAGEVRELDYKTIRYAGHCLKFKAMIDLGLCSSSPIKVDGAEVDPRRVFGRLLELNLPADGPDLVLIRVEFEGRIDGKEKILRYDIVDRQDEKTGLSAMMRTTSFPASVISQMMVRGEVTRRGATPQELAIDPVPFVEALASRNIQMNEYFV